MRSAWLILALLTTSGSANAQSEEKHSNQPASPSVKKLTPGEKRLPSIVVTVVGLKDRRGRVGCALFDKQRHWLTPKAIAGVKRNIPKNQQVVCEFRNVPKGRYAVAITHDEDDDGEVDRGLFGIPSEGYCTSRNAKANFGPPSWEDASFVHSESKPSLLRSAMRY